jgi:hypothetical protein
MNFLETEVGRDEETSMMMMSSRDCVDDGKEWFCKLGVGRGCCWQGMTATR